MKRLITRNNGDVIFLSTFYMNGWINDDDDDDANNILYECTNNLKRERELMLYFNVHYICTIFIRKSFTIKTALYCIFHLSY